ncbi:aminoglycoside N(3)-acetyltransferase [Paenibacillus glycanilyticus]|uniref:Aminoglycoside N(3)-acetyltransferase n=1 Tax=Paenibacillus glycanilyticus TaxID=126569 RepID=A0ABQ6GFU0_9BACL|nr:AAC(3) family N-acetyltransferase [Paenibacillus glycanilyticus]GLX69826.1 AAC(3) family N-acetyltransferase [Paenibacillus glycanilyticus]
MSEHDIIQQSRLPVTVSGMLHDLRQLGIREGDHLIVHSSLSSLGWVCGGPQAVVQSLLQAVGAEGTLIMPAQSGDWSDPAEWAHPPVPQEWIELIYKEMPAFDPAVTPTRGMGRIAELFRTYPGTVRSNHPQVSFCANGKYAEYIVAGHPLTPQFGEASPLGKLYAAGAKVLLLGVGFDSCTSLHLAETRFDRMPTKRMGTAMLVDGERSWQWFTDYEYDSGDFAELGVQLENRVRRGTVGQAECALLDMRAAVDFAVTWLPEHRQG